MDLIDESNQEEKECLICNEPFVKEPTAADKKNGIIKKKISCGHD